MDTRFSRVVFILPGWLCLGVENSAPGADATRRHIFVTRVWPFVVHRYVAQLQFKSARMFPGNSQILYAIGQKLRGLTASDDSLPLKAINPRFRALFSARRAWKLHY